VRGVCWPSHQHDARTQAAASQHPQQHPQSRQPTSAVRARPEQDPFPHLDHDWDIPAFQRKQR
jgi:hypothetical protein